MGTGGSRYGAGRPAHHVKAEHCRRIEAARWAKEGMLRAGAGGSWCWRDADTGELTAQIGYSGLGDAVRLNFSVNNHPVSQHILVLRTACNYGGTRAWFGCPRCSRRVGVLFLRGTAGFVCRHCGRVAYRSQSEDAMGRAWLKQHKAERQLDDGWRRPKGMHQKTYDKLIACIFDCEERRDNALAAFMVKHFPRGSMPW